MMELFVALLGWLTGAGVNWLADSLPYGRRPRRPRCLSCGGPQAPTAWLAPLLGACRYCGHRRGLRPWAVLIGTAGMAVWLYRAPPERLGFAGAFVVGIVFLLIAVIDLEHRLILRVVVYPAAPVFALLGILPPGRGAWSTLLGGAVGFGLLLAMYLLGIAFSRWMARRRRAPLEEVAFGYGDVTLGGLIGLATGWPGVVVAVVAGVLLAGAFSMALVVWMLVRRRYTPFAAIPYGPFLIAGAALVAFGGRTALETLLGAP